MSGLARVIGLGALLVLQGCAHLGAKSEVKPPVPASSAEAMAAKIYSFRHNAEFLFKARVIAADDDTPISHAEVYFIDTGLDTQRAARPKAIQMGTANSGGLVDQRYDYVWYTQASFNSLKTEPPNVDGLEDYERRVALLVAIHEALAATQPVETFGIEIRKDGFAPFRRDIDFTELLKEHKWEGDWSDFGTVLGDHEGYVDWMEKFSDSALDLGTISLEREVRPVSPSIR